MRSLWLVILALLALAPAPTYAQRMTPGLASGPVRVTPAPALNYIQIGDRTNYTQGTYLLYLSDYRNPNQPPTNAPNPIGVDTATLNPGLFGSQGAVSIEWSWPTAAQGKCPLGGGGPCGYMAATRGCYQGTNPAVQVPGVQIGALNTYQSTFDLALTSGDPDYVGLLHEFYTWTTGTCPFPYDDAQRQKEIGFFPHASTEARNFARNNGSDLGTWTDPDTGQKWGVRNVSNVYYTFIPPCDNTPTPPNTCPGSAAGDYLVGSINIKSALQFLVAAGQVNPNHYVRGDAMGWEPTQNVGSGRINSWTVVRNH